MTRTTTAGVLANVASDGGRPAGAFSPSPGGRSQRCAEPIARRAGLRRAALGLLIGLVTVGGTKLLLGQDPALVALTRDPLGVAHAGDPLPFYTGWLSHVGVLGWALAASVLAFTAGRAVKRGEPRVLMLLGGGAALSALLCLDDLLMLHESVIPVLVGVGEEHTMVGLAAVAAVWGLASLRALVRGSSFAVLLVSGAFLSASVMVDLGHLLALPEEGLKLAGIACWVMWAWSTAWESLEPAR